MNLTISDVLSWLIIGAFAGSLAGMIVKRKKSGLGHLANLTVGLVGAMIGGAAVRLLKIDFGIGKIVLRWEDMAFALIGSLIFIVIYSVLRKRSAKKLADGVHVEIA
jgi:uncharacterized membrane protein YeaQ/YmgE (transglycosylase-associated protein family)